MYESVISLRYDCTVHLTRDLSDKSCYFEVRYFVSNDVVRKILKADTDTSIKDTDLFQYLFHKIQEQCSESSLTIYHDHMNSS